MTDRSYNRVEKLDQLSPGAVVIDIFDHAWQQGLLHRDPYWYRAYGDDTSVSSWDLSFRGPFKVIWPASEAGKIA